MIMRSLKLVVVGLTLMAVLGLSTAALADPSGGPVRNPDIQGEELGQPEQRGATTNPRGSALPFTGADITLFAVIGLSAIVAGTLLVRRTRVRETAS
jgi:hypothetical protein